MRTYQKVILAISASFSASFCWCEEVISPSDQFIETHITIFTLKDGREVKAKKAKQADGKWELTHLAGFTEFINENEVKTITNTTIKTAKPVSKEAERKADAKAYWQGRIEKERQESADKEALAPFKKMAIETALEANKIKSQLDDKVQNLQLAKNMKRDVPVRINELQASIRAAEIAFAKAPRETSGILKADLDRLIRAKTDPEQLLAFAVDAQPTLEQEVATLKQEFQIAQKNSDEAQEALQAEEAAQLERKTNPFRK
jgi:hypothetical protein